MQASDRYQELARAPGAELERLMRESQAPALESILGKEYRGWNTPAYCSALGIRKFIKGFFGDPAAPEGYNIPARQNALDEPWLHKPSADHPKRFGFYALRRARGGDAQAAYAHALLLDYGASARNMALAPERLLRDYLVVPDPARPDLLLGRAFLALGARVPVSYFILEELRISTWKP